MEELIQDWKQRKRTTKKQHKKLVNRLQKRKSKSVDEIGEELHEEVFGEIDCMQCANCCTSIPPMLNRADTRRIAKHLGMKPAQFKEAYIRVDEDGDMVMKTTPCPFLLPDNACSIYEYRPKACREYPHTNQLEFSKHLKLHAVNAQYCPAVFHILERMVALKL